jgi:aldehyde dehydrogenase (NAD+)/betaine-aldehyde dehydrogenase
LTGGRAPSGFPGGFYEPTVIAVPSPEIACVRQGCWPRAVGSDLPRRAEALRLANDSQYAFAAGVFTTNLARAHRMIARLRSGIVWVNTYRAVSPIVPFGGNRLTGYGREGGLDTVYDYTRTKAVWINTSDVPLADPFVLR